MKSSLLYAATAFGIALAFPSIPSQGDDRFHKWHPAGPADVRAPCPMLNSLANHGFLPHDGKAITENITISALNAALNINETLARFLHEAAATTNPQPNATTYDLDHLNRHNFLEHDASLSRVDLHFGNVQPFNQTVFDKTRAFFTDEIITVQMAANARKAAIDNSNATNPEFSLSEQGEGFSLGESVAYIIALGDAATHNVRRDLVEYLFEKERLPVELGWSRRKEVIKFEELSEMIEKLANATASVPSEARHLARNAGFHAGVRAPMPRS
ncbi:Cloroperoxidase [Polyplosphaeria fusca]|uniref:Cloroperoxidase n=1 Tax=Polyplosphaeria fusca TaxID=682080 RepID=A0A9P4V3B2_9PLEO|nr:Cloroperoxidase [Polyplosphaeria fusca]